MKARHASALTLVGWLLVFPPHQPPRNVFFGLEKSKGPYKSYEECRQVIDNMSNNLAAENHEQSLPPELAHWFAQCRCVRQDDKPTSN
jgi:hypothetical protein